jgi:hypothetical protein
MIPLASGALFAAIYQSSALGIVIAVVCLMVLWRASDVFSKTPIADERQQKFYSLASIYCTVIGFFMILISLYFSKKAILLEIFASSLENMTMANTRRVVSNGHGIEFLPRDPAPVLQGAVIQKENNVFVGVSVDKFFSFVVESLEKIADSYLWNAFLLSAIFAGVIILAQKFAKFFWKEGA